MRINNNIMAMNTHRQYATNNNRVAKSTERLSSGSKINRAGDDAAGLAISEKMRAQIRGLNMASKNSNDAISLVQTAEGALTETHSILQRINELAVQSASDTNEDDVDREALQSEFSALRSEIDDIANKTTFNNKKLLNGSFGTKYTIDAASELKEGSNGLLNIKFSGFTASGSITFTQGAGNTISASMTTGGNTYTATGVQDADGAGTLTFQLVGTGTVAGQELGTLTIEKASGYTVAAGVGIAALNTLDFTATAGSAKIQTGANAGETLDISIASMTTSSLALSTLDISSRDGARVAISTVQTAINMVSTQRSELGAIQNRLEHKINNLDTSAENLQAAESRIRDIDMAKQMTEFTTQNILVQAATAMLAQANSAPQNVLSLLKQ